MRTLEGEEEKEAVERMKLAAVAAKNALCLKAKCGTVIFSSDIKLIGTGYNAPPQDDLSKRRCDEDACCVHAEWRAIADALAHHPKAIKGALLYFTRVDWVGNILPSGKPYCTVCSRLALDTAVSYFYLWHEEGITEYKTDEYHVLSCQNKST